MSNQSSRSITLVLIDTYESTHFVVSFLSPPSPSRFKMDNPSKFASIHSHMQIRVLINPLPPSLPPPSPAPLRPAPSRSLPAVGTECFDRFRFSAGGFRLPARLYCRFLPVNSSRQSTRKRRRKSSCKDGGICKTLDRRRRRRRRWERREEREEWK